jgi:hypothetical protein
MMPREKYQTIITTFCPTCRCNQSCEITVQSGIVEGFCLVCLNYVYVNNEARLPEVQV